ncbi:MAG: S1 RNA-binding domain-containing protein [Nitrospirales bacterium]
MKASGALVGGGVHEDSLVPISSLANQFVRNPHTVMLVNQHVKVPVLECGISRQRIALFMQAIPNNTV